MLNRQADSKINFGGQRGLGLGFGEGNAFHLFSHEPNRGLINELPLTEDVMSKIREVIGASINLSDTNIVHLLKNTLKEVWVDAEENDINEIVESILALSIPDILVDMNITRLQKTLPMIVNNFSDDIKNILAKNGLDNFSDIAGKRFLRSIIVSKYELFTADNKEEEIAKKLNEINTILSSGKLSLLDAEIMAYLIPAILDRMSDEDLTQVAFVIAENLDIKYFKPLADKNYFLPQIDASNDDVIKIKNANKRSLQFFASASNTRAFFRGQNYTLQHTHIHFEKDGEENEYDLDGKKFDGEIHSVFELNLHGNVNKKRLMAVGFSLQIAEQDNPQIQKLLDIINNLDEIKQWKKALTEWKVNSNNEPKPQLLFDMQKLEISTNYKETFMTYFDQAKENNVLIFHSWGSLRSSTYGFRSGLRFVISPIAIQVSEAQYKELKEIFGEMNKNLKEEDKLDPIDRKAGHRKQRELILKSLKDMTQGSKKLVQFK